MAKRRRRKHQLEALKAEINVLKSAVKQLTDHHAFNLKETPPKTTKIEMTDNEKKLLRDAMAKMDCETTHNALKLLNVDVRGKSVVQLSLKEVDDKTCWQLWDLLFKNENAPPRTPIGATALSKMFA